MALIGYGLAGRSFHAPLIEATPGLTLALVVTASPERRAQLARDHPQAEVVGTPAELWERDDVDLVVVAAPNTAHGELAHAAIARGLPVVVDKPLAVTAGEAEAVVQHAQEAGVVLTVFQNRRWDSDHLTLVRLIADGRLGAVMRYESRFERWRPHLQEGAWREELPPQEGGGALLDLGSHLVDQALVLFGPVVDVYAEVDARRGAPADDDDFVALRHRDGTISHLRASATTAAPGPRLRVLGTEAAFVVADLDSQEDELRAGRYPQAGHDWGVEPESRWGRLVTGEHSAPVRSERGDWPRFYVLLVDALRVGAPPPVDPSDAVATLRVLERARRSAAERDQT